MENLLILIFDLYLLIGYAVAGFIVFMLVQGLVYWTTGFSIYKYLVYNLFDKQLTK